MFDCLVQPARKIEAKATIDREVSFLVIIYAPIKILTNLDYSGYFCFDQLARQIRANIHDSYLLNGGGSYTKLEPNLP